MGGHGGLNILPQKRWNVYRFDNMEKVRQDEEAAAKEEQLKREQSRKRDAEFRLEQLRTARGLAPLKKGPEPAEGAASEAVVESEEESGGHINLFHGIKIFDPVQGLEKEKAGEKEKDGPKKKKMKKEEAPRVVGPEDEKFKLGYGLAGKGVKLPWYLEKRTDDREEEKAAERSSRGAKKEEKKSGKKTIQELREERLKREKQEKDRQQALLVEKSRIESQRNGTFSAPLMKDGRFSRR